LDVAMDDALRVRRGETARDLGTVVDGLAQRDRGRQLLPECLAVEQLHDGKGRRSLAAERENREDVRMGQRGDGLGFALEPRERGGVFGKTRRQDLDRNVAIERRLARAIDLAHPAGADGRDYLVATES